jgi:hypothetical protein
VKDDLGYIVRGIVYDEHEINKLSTFQPESFKHFLCKAIVFHKLRQMKHKVLSEVEIPGCGIADVLDLTTSVQYEIELSHSKGVRKRKEEMYKRTGWEIIVIDCSKLSTDVDGIWKYLDEFIIPG